MITKDDFPKGILSSETKEFQAQSNFHEDKGLKTAMTQESHFERDFRSEKESSTAPKSDLVDGHHNNPLYDSFYLSNQMGRSQSQKNSNARASFKLMFSEDELPKAKVDINRLRTLGKS